MAQRRQNPPFYHEVFRAIKRANPTWTDARCWATTYVAIARGALTGDTNFPGLQSIGPMKRAKFIAAYAAWKKTHPKGSGLGANPAGRG